MNVLRWISIAMEVLQQHVRRIVLCQQRTVQRYFFALYLCLVQILSYILSLRLLDLQLLLNHA